MNGPGYKLDKMVAMLRADSEHFNLQRSRFIDWKPQLDGADLSRADLDGVNFCDVRLRRANLADAMLGGADLSRADLEDADLRGTRLHGARWLNTNFRGSLIDERTKINATQRCVWMLHNQREQVTALPSRCMRDCDLGSVSFAGLALENVDFSYGIVRGCSFAALSLVGARFEMTNATDADFQGADLRRACLDYAGLSGAHFAGADLRDAKLSFAFIAKAHFNEADLRGADLSGVKSWQSIKSVTGARFDQRSRYPDGFRAWAEGKGARFEAPAG